MSWVCARNRVARFNLDMSLDTSFNIGAGPNGVVTQLTVQDGSKDRPGGQLQLF